MNKILLHNHLLSVGISFLMTQAESSRVCRVTDENRKLQIPRGGNNWRSQSIMSKYMIKVILLSKYTYSLNQTNERTTKRTRPESDSKKTNNNNNDGYQESIMFVPNEKGEAESGHLVDCGCRQWKHRAGIREPGQWWQWGCMALLFPSFLLLCRLCDRYYWCCHVGDYGCPNLYIMYDNRWCDTVSNLWDFPHRLLLVFNIWYFAVWCTCLLKFILTTIIFIYKYQLILFLLYFLFLKRRILFSRNRICPI